MIQTHRLRAAKVGGAILLTALVFFCASKWLPPTDTHAISAAVSLGYTDRLPPLVAVLLAGALAVGLLLSEDAGELPRRISETAAPVAHWRWHLAVACLISVLQVSLFPIWSRDDNYFGVRIALMVAHKLPYRDFEFAYGYATAYLPYWLHMLGLSISQALVTTLAVAALAGVLSVGLFLQSAIAQPAMRLTLFWVLVVAGLLLEPGPSLTYNLCRFASPFALLLLLVRHAPRLGPIALFAAAGGAQVLVYFISPEMGVAFSVALFVWLALSWRELPGVKLAAAAAAVILSGAGLLIFAQPMFATLFNYMQAQIGMPVVPDIIMMLFVACLPIMGGVGLRIAQKIWCGSAVDGADQALIGAGACSALAGALIPVVVGRSWPTYTVAYGFATIVLTAGFLAAAGKPRAAWVVASVFALFIGYSALDGLRTSWLPLLSNLRHGCASSEPQGCDHGQAQERRDTLEVGQWLRTSYGAVYDPLAAVGYPQPTTVNLGFYTGMTNISTVAALNAKKQELINAKFYIVPNGGLEKRRFDRKGSEQGLAGFRTAALYPFSLSSRPGAPKSLKTVFVDALFSRCRPIASHGPVTVCVLQNPGG